MKDIFYRQRRRRKSPFFWILFLISRSFFCMRFYILCNSTYFTLLSVQLNSLCNLHRPARERLLTAVALFDDHVIYPYSLTWLGSTRGTGFQTHSQVCRAEGLNPWPLDNETSLLPLRLWNSCTDTTIHSRDLFFSFKTHYIKSQIKN